MDTKSTTSIVVFGLNLLDTWRMGENGKRTVQVNVKMSGEDYDLLRKAADKLWPDAILSNSGILLGLARLSAKDILAKKPKRPTKRSAQSNGES